MFDIVGKRRWFYAFSLLIMIPGLIFIALTPFSDGKAGLRFSIDFTGGTVWEIHFRDGTPPPSEVDEVMAELGLPGSVAITTAGDREYVLIRTEQIGLRPGPSPIPTPAPSGSPGASGTPGASVSPGPSVSVGPSTSPGPSGTPGASSSPARPWVTWYHWNGRR